MSITNIEVKKKQVEELKQKIESSTATVVVNYEGITVAQMSELREQLRAEDVELTVIKNNISTKAFAAANFSDIKESLKGPTAVAFSKNDVTAAARILNDFSKTNKVLELRAGTFDGKYATADQVKELSSLPGKDGMLSMLLSVMQAPIRGLAQTMSQVAEKKEQ